MRRQQLEMSMPADEDIAYDTSNGTHEMSALKQPAYSHGTSYQQEALLLYLHDTSEMLFH